MSTTTGGLPPAISELDEILDHLSQSRQRAASAFAAEMFFFERVSGLLDKREQERATQVTGAITSSSQLAMREVFAEIGAALRLSEWQVARKVSVAWALTNRFHETLCDASCGQISPDHATLIADIGADIADDSVRADYETVARDMALEMTPGQLGPALSGLVVRLDPEGTERRVREAAQRRKVTVRELEPGLSRITADVPTAQGVGAYNRLRDMAAELFDLNSAEKAEAQAVEAAASTTDAGSTARGADAQTDGPTFDERTHAQIMADVFCDLLLTSAADGHGATKDARDALGAITATVQVTIPATALAGQTIGGATVSGFGPIDNDTATLLVGATPSWTRVFTDPCRGVPISVDRYRPTKKQKLFLQVRDQQCRFPGCRRVAQQCEIDHTVARIEDGPTCLCNLEHLCKRHHTLKHETDWSVEQLPGGVLRWTAPTGRTHLTRPPGTVRFDPVALIDPDPLHRHQIERSLARDPAPF
ncbi:hypothetical protein GCM10022240_24450 [Microbacterium kribbense]|uniref:HNH nuclease domain-containing protein n=1 Tax=Microbacterium kribbense TaxID=433645 RepID=A0ABP7GSL7_9MICO